MTTLNQLMKIDDDDNDDYDDSHLPTTYYH